MTHTNKLVNVVICHLAINRSETNTHRHNRTEYSRSKKKVRDALCWRVRWHGNCPAGKSFAHFPVYYGKLGWCMTKKNVQNLIFFIIHTQICLRVVLWLRYASVFVLLLLLVPKYGNRKMLTEMTIQFANKINSLLSLGFGAGVKRFAVCGREKKSAWRQRCWVTISNDFFVNYDCWDTQQIRFTFSLEREWEIYAFQKKGRPFCNWFKPTRAREEYKTRKH